jgi:hypothetical protein
VRAVQRTRTLAAVALAAAALLAGCGSDDESSSPTTAATTKSPEALKAALLSPADVPGSTVSTSPGTDADLSACFPGNPLGGKDFPGEVEGPDLELTEGDVQRQYGSSLRQATEDQAKEFVSTFSSEKGSQCVLNSFKTAISSDPSPPKLDPSGLTGKVADASVADDGAVLTVSGNLTAGGQSVPIGVELLAFRKGSTVVLMSAGAVQGPAKRGQAVELAQKVAGRL